MINNLKFKIFSNSDMSLQLAIFIIWKKCEASSKKKLAPCDRDFKLML